MKWGMVWMVVVMVIMMLSEISEGVVRCCEVNVWSSTFSCFLGVIKVFSGSLEFEKRYNQEVQERPSDNIELPKVC